MIRSIVFRGPATTCELISFILYYFLARVDIIVIFAHDDHPRSRIFALFEDSVSWLMVHGSRRPTSCLVIEWIRAKAYSYTIARS